MYRRLRRRTAPPAAFGDAQPPTGDDTDTDAPASFGPPMLVTTISAASSELSGLRAQIADFTRDHGGSDDVVDDLELIVSELATNVVRHTNDPDITLTVRVDAVGESGTSSHDLQATSTPVHRRWTLHMTGASDLADFDAVDAPPVDQEGGRGLLIVRAVADDVVVDRAGGTVRCTLVG